MNPPPARKLLILGWDAADWQMIRRLTDKGGMPNLRRLLRAGTQADLATLEPRLSPLLWSTVATGKTADKHGILNFVEPDAENQNLRPASSTTRRTKALWNILHQSGLRTHVVSWYASHPSEPVRGGVVTNLLSESQPANPRQPWPLLAGAVHPPELADQIAAARVHPGAVPDRVLARLVPQWAKLGRDHARISTLSRLVAQCLSVHQAAKTLMQADPAWDCAMVFHEAIDTIGHHFMQFFPPKMKHVAQRDFELFSKVMPGVYELHDELLGEMLRLAGPDCTVMLLSDHGFHSADQRPVTEGLSDLERAATEAAWHREHGILVLHGPGVRPEARVLAPSLLDIAPTALALLGLPAGRDMDGRVLEEAISVSTPERIESWDAVEGDDARHPPDMRQDPFEAHDAIRQLIDLGYMAALPEDAQARIDLTRRETAFNLGMVLIHRGRSAEAVGVLAPLVEQHPEEARYALSLAKACLACARFDQADEALVRLLASDGSNAEAVMFRISVLAGAGRTDEAWALLEPRLTSAADTPLALADLCASVGRWEESQRQASRALASAPKDPAAALALARAEIVLGRFEPAAERCLDVLETHTVHPEAHHQLGLALAWLGELGHAADSFVAVVSVQPGRIEAHRFLAALRRHAGDQAGAQEADDRAESVLETLAPDPAQRALAERQSPRGPAAWLAGWNANGGGAS